jgi:hypothetical protein
MNYKFFAGTFLILTIMACAGNVPAGKEKTIFQDSRPWNPFVDMRADVVMVYGVRSVGNYVDMTFEQRLQSWREQGYITHFMTGIAWGNYEDYFSGQWDGTPHLDEGQVTATGDTIWHEGMVPYIVPSAKFLQYMKETVVKQVIDAGVDAIYMEEPEFWARAGYSEAFKREWQDYYGFAWRPQHETPENAYLSHKLKYHLYYRALEDVFTFAKAYGKSKGMNVRCYVPTHSLVNYSSWNIISPEASLASLDCVDGYIAQVWTGTSRETTFYNGVEKERVFENAFLEYGSMESMTRPTGRKMFFLTDPIEDWPRDWVDYKKNYEATFTAQLLYPMIANYEVMPWPGRVYESLHNTCATCTTKEKIPSYYATQLQVMINTLNDMPVSENRVSGAQGIGVLMSNTLMFQRHPIFENYDDLQFSNFYGQTLPLLKRGIPVETLHIENVSYPDTWKDLKILVMSYANMKPVKEEYHRHIAQWVKQGGTLIYCGKDIDPYQSVMEWWNTNGNTYQKPSMHLFEQLGLASSNPQTGEYAAGKGKVYVLREEPMNFVLQPEGDTTYLSVVKQAFESIPGAGRFDVKNSFYLERGPYVVASVMDESVSADPLVLNGLFIDLFNPDLPVLQTKTVNPGEQAYLYDVTQVKDKNKPSVLCGGSRIYDEQVKRGSFAFTAKGPEATNSIMRVYLPTPPQEVNLPYSWDETSHTCLLKFENKPEGVSVVINY